MHDQMAPQAVPGNITGYMFMLLYTNPPTSDYNDIFVNGVGGVVGFSTSDQLTLGDWQSASGQDANSISADPLFTSTSNLLPLAGSPLVGGALSIEAITDDITGLARDLSIPTIGAYEVAPPPCENPTIAGVIATSQSGCGSFDPALITSTSPASGETGDIGIQMANVNHQQWDLPILQAVIPKPTIPVYYHKLPGTNDWHV